MAFCLNFANVVLKPLVLVSQAAERSQSRVGSKFQPSQFREDSKQGGNSQLQICNERFKTVGVVEYSQKRSNRIQNAGGRCGVCSGVLEYHVEYRSMVGVLEYGWSTGVSTGVLESHLKYRNIIKSMGLPDQYSSTPTVLRYSNQTPILQNNTPVLPLYFSTPSDLPIFQSKLHTMLMLEILFVYF